MVLDRSIDCIMLTLNAEKHLKETLDVWYRVAPIRRLLVIDGGSMDETLRILMQYRDITIISKPGMTTGKAWEILKDMVQTPWFIWIDVGKIPKDGWYEEMMKYTDEGDILGSLRYRNDYGCESIDPTIADSSKRLLGGPWLIRTSSLKSYHVDDDYAQRNIDIIIRKQLEETGGRYKLVRTTSHFCHTPIPVTDKEELQKRHVQNAKGIVKYISPDYARKHASYLLDDHWMLMMNGLPMEWIQEMNPSWVPVLKQWRRKRLVIAKSLRIGYNILKRMHVV